MVQTVDEQQQYELGKLLQRINEVSTLPNMLQEIIRVTNDPNADAMTLGHVIERDPAVAARVLRCANSVAYGLRHRIDSLQMAISYLGFSQVRNLAMSASICKVFQNDIQLGNYTRHGLWHHMASVAITARLIAHQQGVRNPDEVFLAGLLHDLGIILEDQYMHEPFAHMMRHFPASYTLVQAEREVFGFDHTELGARVADMWQLPAAVRDTIRHHHNLYYDTPHAQTIACVELANVMCSIKGVRSVGVPVSRISPSVIKHLRLRKGGVNKLIEEMFVQIEQNEQLLRLEAA